MSPASKRLLSSSRSPAHPSKKFHAGNVSPEEGEVEDPSAALPGPSQVPMLVERDGPRSDSFSRMALPFKPKGLPSGGSGPPTPLDYPPRGSTPPLPPSRQRPPRDRGRDRNDWHGRNSYASRPNLDRYVPEYEDEVEFNNWDTRYDSDSHYRPRDAPYDDRRRWDEPPPRQSGDTRRGDYYPGDTQIDYRRRPGHDAGEYPSPRGHFGGSSYRPHSRDIDVMPHDLPPPLPPSFDLPPPPPPTASPPPLPPPQALRPLPPRPAMPLPAPPHHHAPPPIHVPYGAQFMHAPNVVQPPPAPQRSPIPPPPNGASAPAVSKQARLEVVEASKDKEKSMYGGRQFVGTAQLQEYEMLDKLGEGTFGEVHKALHVASGKMVALKRILMHNEKEGFPITALREIKILKKLQHPNVVTLTAMIVSRSAATLKSSIYMVFPYMDHDLSGLLENKSNHLAPSQIKLYMKQLCEGVSYLHRNKILHRDLKSANLLISNEGVLQIADFGLARPVSQINVTPRAVGTEWKGGRRDAEYTNCVVTRWYRAPELLLGETRYGGAIDLWSVGCIFGEMFVRKPIFMGTSDVDQLEKIFDTCGSPNNENFPGWNQLPGSEGIKEWKRKERKVKLFTEHLQLPADTADFLDKLLTLDPCRRMTALEALDHDYFWTDPMPADPKTLRQYASSHEYNHRRKPAPGPPPRPQNAMPPQQNGSGQMRFAPRAGGPRPPAVPPYAGQPYAGNAPMMNGHPYLPPPPPPTADGLPPPRGFRGPPTQQHHQYPPGNYDAQRRPPNNRYPPGGPPMMKGNGRERDERQRYPPPMGRDDPLPY